MKLKRIPGEHYGEKVTFKMPESKCPLCGRILQAASGDRQPTPGDISVCTECGGLALFDSDLILRELTPEELEAVPQELRSMVAAKRERLDAINELMKNGWVVVPDDPAFALIRKTQKGLITLLMFQTEDLAQEAGRRMPCTHQLKKMSAAEAVYLAIEYGLEGLSYVEATGGISVFMKPKDVTR